MYEVAVENLAHHAFKAGRSDFGMRCKAVVNCMRSGAMTEDEEHAAWEELSRLALDYGSAQITPKMSAPSDWS